MGWPFSAQRLGMLLDLCIAQQSHPLKGYKAPPVSSTRVEGLHPGVTQNTGRALFEGRSTHRGPLT